VLQLLEEQLLQALELLSELTLPDDAPLPLPTAKLETSLRTRSEAQ
jgi:hypothetical protein